MLETSTESARVMDMSIELSNIKVGQILRSIDDETVNDIVIPSHLQRITEFMDEIKAMKEQNKAPTKKEFIALYNKYEREFETETSDQLGDLLLSENLVQVTKKETDANGKTIIELTPMDKNERVRIVKELASKLVAKLSKEELQSLLEEAIRINPDTGKLTRINEKLNSNKVEVSGKKGCYMIVVGDETLQLI